MKQNENLYKTGDKGMTKLVGSSTVAKDSDRVESYGTIDELNSWVGYIISQLPQENQGIKEELEALQHLLFDAGTDLSTPIEAQRPFKLQKESVHWLEQRIDFYTAQSPDIDRFILPGGTSAYQYGSCGSDDCTARRTHHCSFKLDSQN